MKKNSTKKRLKKTFSILAKTFFLVKTVKKKKPKATKKNLKANAAKGSLLSIMGFVVTKAEDHKIIKINGNILIIKAYKVTF